MSDALDLRIGLPVPVTQAPAPSNFVLNQTTDQLEIIWQVEVSAQITRIGVRLGVVTGTCPTYKVSVQGVDASGNPDGVIKGGGSPASGAFNPGTLGWAAGSWNWVNLDNAYTPARGEMVALVVSYSAGTIDAGNNASFTGGLTNTAFNLPLVIQNDNGSRSKQAQLPSVALGSATTAYGRPFLAAAQPSWQTASNPNEYAIKFVVPTDWCNSFKVAGIAVNMATNAGSSFLVRLYDVDGVTVLQDVTIDGDWPITGVYRQVEVRFDEATLATLSPGVAYRIGIISQNANPVSVAVLDVASVNDWAAWPYGSQFSVSTRQGAGAWTEVPTRRMIAELILAEMSVSPPTDSATQPYEVVIKQEMTPTVVKVLSTYRRKFAFDFCNFAECLQGDSVVSGSVSWQGAAPGFVGAATGVGTQLRVTLDSFVKGSVYYGVVTVTTTNGSKLEADVVLDATAPTGF